MKILVTAFGPFGNCQTNSSEQVLHRLPVVIGDGIVRKLLLPVSFRRCLEPIEEYLATEKVNLIVALGQASGRCDISVERRAVNIAHAKSPDNDGCRPDMAPIIDDAPRSYESGIPIYEICDCLKATGIPCHVSDSAGRYVCNTLYYHLLHAFPSIPSVFIHLPCASDRAGIKKAHTPAMSLPAMTRAVETLIAAIVSMHRQR